MVRCADPALSTLAVVHELEPLDGPRDPGNPLEFTGGKVVPELSGEVKAGQDVRLFFVVYPDVSAQKPGVTVEFQQDGRTVSSAQQSPGSPDEVNSLPMITSVRLPAGDYVARVSVEQAGRRTQEAIAVRVVP